MGFENCWVDKERKKIRFRSGQSGVLRRKREKPKGEVKFFYKYKKVGKKATRITQTGKRVSGKDPSPEVVRASKD